MVRSIELPAHEVKLCVLQEKLLVLVSLSVGVLSLAIPLTSYFTITGTDRER